VAADALAEVFENFEEVSPSATRVKVRDRYVELPPANRTSRSGSPPSSPATTPNPSPSPTSPATSPTSEDLWRTTPDELRACIPDLPFLTHVDE
jgi:hypothetical protein